MKPVDLRNRDAVLPHEARRGEVYVIYDPVDDSFYCAHAQAWVGRYRVFQRMPPHRWHPDEIRGQSARDLCAVATRYTQANVETLRSINAFPSNGVLLEIGEEYGLGDP